jgi:hypothetical protein
MAGHLARRRNRLCKRLDLKWLLQLGRRAESGGDIFQGLTGREDQLKGALRDDVGNGKAHATAPSCRRKQSAALGDAG